MARKQPAEEDILCHVYCPNSSSSAKIQNSGLVTVDDRNSVKSVAAGYKEELVKDIHTILLLLYCADRQSIASTAKHTCMPIHYPYTAVPSSVVGEEKRKTSRCRTSSHGYMYMPCM
jgi:hypothetical protein